MNISQYSDEKTARTCELCAYQRAENLSILGAKSVLELMVGPSLKTLERYYNQFNISVIGNDIDPRWQRYYPNGQWIIGDATKINSNNFDAVVIAPPLSKNCSGKRDDALSIDDVVPSYYNFLNLKSQIKVFVLPAKTLSIRKDRNQSYKFLSHLSGKVEIVPLKNKIVKYIDVYNENL
jgi:hypothetical protein